MKKVSILLAATMLLSVSSASYSQSVKRQTISRLSGKTSAAATISSMQAANAFVPAAQTTIRLPQKEVQSFWTGDSWLALQNLTHQYNSRGQLMTSEATSTLIPGTTRTTHAYDAQGRDTLELSQIKLGNTWINDDMTRTKYDQHGHMTYLGMLEWNTATSQWDVSSATKHTHTYGSGNRLEQTISSEYWENNWSEVTKTVYGYVGSSTLPVTITTYQMLEDTWVEEERLTNLVYTQNQFEQSYVLQHYAGGGGEEGWYNHSRHTFSYASNPATNTFTVIEVLDAFEDNTWVPFSRTTIEATHTNHLLQYKEEDYENGQWVLDSENSQMNEVQTDSEGNITEIVYRFFDDDAGEVTNFVKFNFSEFVDITITGAGKEMVAAATQLYPNPVTDKLNIVLDAAKVEQASLSVHSITGQKMYELSSLRGEATIDMSAYPKGVYLVRIAGADNAGVTRKVVKQ